MGKHKRRKLAAKLAVKAARYGELGDIAAAQVWFDLVLRYGLRGANRRMPLLPPPAPELVVVK